MIVFMRFLVFSFFRTLLHRVTVIVNQQAVGGDRLFEKRPEHMHVGIVLVDHVDARRGGRAALDILLLGRAVGLLRREERPARAFRLAGLAEIESVELHRLAVGGILVVDLRADKAEIVGLARQFRRVGRVVEHGLHLVLRIVERRLEQAPADQILLADLLAMEVSVRKRDGKNAKNTMF